MKPSHILLLSFSILTSALITSCGENNDRRQSLDDTHPYKSTSIYENVLKSCAQTETTIGSCRLNKLPILGMEVDTPSIDDIMSRVVVSHDWMGERFEELLNELPTDIQQLLGAVTVIVIDDDIRPSYYHTLTGAIYLDPINLWMSQEEKDTIDKEADHREAYAKPMSFRSLWRYTKNSADAYHYYNFDSEEERPFEDIIIPMAALLYHELGHANDAFTIGRYAGIDSDERIYTAADELLKESPSHQLTQDYPLSSNEMFSIAGILYKGNTPSEGDKSLTASEIGGFFAPDAASDDYAYTSRYEDTAMLFEETMMKLHFGVDRDMGFTTQPRGEGISCDDHKIGWGVRNRIADSQVMPRAQFIIEQLLPDNDYSSFFDNLDPPRYLPVGQGWCESISLNIGSSEKASIQAQSRSTKPLRKDHVTRPYSIHL